MVDVTQLERVGELEFDELAQLEQAFDSDLELVFDGKAKEFAPHLRGMLFELWMRARDRPGGITQRLGELEELEKKKLEVREEVSSEFERQLPAVTQQFKSQFESAASSTFNLNFVAALELEDFTVDTAIVKMLERVLKLHGLELTNFVNNLELKTSGSSSIPKLEDYDSDDEFQKVLQARLLREGFVLPGRIVSSSDWRPVFMNTETGRQGALDVSADLFTNVELISTYLVEDAGSWRFPYPPPAYDYDLCEHVQLIVDGLEQVNAACTWNHEYHQGLRKQIVASVTIHGTLPTNAVQARYTSVVRRPIP